MIISRLACDTPCFMLMECHKPQRRWHTPGLGLSVVTSQTCTERPRGSRALATSSSQSARIIVHGLAKMDALQNEFRNGVFTLCLRKCCFISELSFLCVYK